MQKILFSLLFLSFAFAASAQQKSQSFQDIEKQMQQFMEEFRKGFSGGSFFNIPEGDSSYTFRFDTTIVGDNFSGMFHFGPFGSDSTMRSNPFGSDFFHQFFQGFDDPFFQTIPNQENREEGSQDGEQLLPEERRRLEEEKEQSAKDGSGKSKQAPSERSKIKTIRI